MRRPALPILSSFLILCAWAAHTHAYTVGPRALLHGSSLAAPRPHSRLGSARLRPLPLCVRRERASGVRMLARGRGEEVCVVQMGGTVDKDYPRKTMGYAFEIADSAAERIVRNCAPTLPIIPVVVCRKDSTELEDSDREALLSSVRDSKATKFIVTHGTDTMIETAQYLSARHKDFPSSVIVFTGSLTPERFKGSDADFNVGCAVGAVQACLPGVYIAMAGRVIPADECLRDMDTGGYYSKKT